MPNGIEINNIIFLLFIPWFPPSTIHLYYFNYILFSVFFKYFFIFTVFLYFCTIRKNAPRHVLAPNALLSVDRLRHSSSSCECASPAHSAFCFIGSSFGISYEIKNCRQLRRQQNILLLSVINFHQQSQSVYPAVQNNYIRNLPSAADTWRYL